MTDAADVPMPVSPSRRRSRAKAAAVAVTPDGAVAAAAVHTGHTDLATLAIEVGEHRETLRRHDRAIGVLEAGQDATHRDVQTILERLGQLDLTQLASDVRTMAADNAEQTRRTQEVQQSLRRAGGKVALTVGGVLSAVAIATMTAYVKSLPLGLQMATVAGIGLLLLLGSLGYITLRRWA